jgi:hypothetical protein
VAGTVVHFMATANADSGPNQPFRLVENHHFLRHCENNKAESADIAKTGWPMKCSQVKLEFITTAVEA